MMNLGNGGQRFNEMASYYAPIPSSDGEELRWSITPVNFRCGEFELERVNRAMIAEGVASTMPTLAILTNFKDAKDFNPEGKIKYRNYTYNIAYVGEIKNHSNRVSKSYVIGLN